VIALHLVEKPGPLRGDEIRFLRKWAGFPARQFAALVGVSPEHLSRIENGHTDALGPPSDRLARAIAVASRDADEAREILLRVAGELEATRRPKGAGGVFSLERNRWKAAA
jgi:transcriptional regulator with XRE-family HTH domain